MDKFAALSRGTQVMLASAVLLLIDSFFHWQSFHGFGFNSGWSGFGGVVLGLLTLAVIAWVIVRIVQPELLRSIPIPEGTLALALGAAILIDAVLKNLIDDYSAWPAYVGVVLAAGIAVGGWMVAQEQGGADKAMAWRPSRGGSSTAAPPPSPPPPVAEPPAPTAPEETPRPPAPQPPVAPVVPGEPSRTEPESHDMGDTTPSEER